MTDVYAQELLIKKFLELEGLTKVKLNDEDESEEYTYPEVALPNETFTRPEDGYWYELNPIPGKPVQIELGSEARSRWAGIFQVNICVPRNSGREALNDRFEAVAALFRSGLIIEGVRIRRTYSSSALEDGDFRVLPVTIEWWSDLDR